MKSKKQKKGISLIVLVITIIVMLILAATVVISLNNTGIIERANEAVDKTNIAVEKEKLASLVVGAVNKRGVVDFKTLDKIIAEDDTFEGTNGTYKGLATGNMYTVGSYGEVAIVKVQNTVQVGDIIKYDETDVSKGTILSYTTDSSKGTYAKIDQSSGTYTIDGANNTIAAGDLEWRVLGTNDKGQVELISTKPTTASLVIKGNEGFTNAVSDEKGNLGTLDTFCNNLYGKGKGAISARSLNIEDIMKLTNDSTPLATTKRYSFAWLTAMYEYMCGGSALCRALTSSLPDVSNISDWENTWYDSVTFPDGTTLDQTTPDVVVEYDLCENNRIVHYSANAVASSLLAYSFEIEGWIGTYYRAYPSWLSNYNISGIDNKWLEGTRFRDEIKNEICIYTGDTAEFGYLAISSDIDTGYSLRPVVVLDSKVQFVPVDKNADGETDYFNIKVN